MEITALLSRAEAGDVEAQCELAQRLYTGDGVPIDRQAAIVWGRRAAETGNAWAQTFYAITLRQSKSPEDERESILWLERAATQGDARALFNLGLQQMYGIGTEPNPIDAIAKAVRASLSGFDEASKFIAELAPNINPEQWAGSPRKLTGQS